MLCALALCGWISTSAPADAEFILTYAEVGADVVATGSGSIDTTDLSLAGQVGVSVAVAPGVGLAVNGPTNIPLADAWGGISGPSAIGGGGADFASSGSGEIAGMYGLAGQLLLPVGYTSGNALSDTSTYDNKTFATLGLTPGTYTWTWGSGMDADSFVIQIGSTQTGVAMPEPSSLLLGAVPLAFLLGSRRRGNVRAV